MCLKRGQVEICLLGQGQGPDRNQQTYNSTCFFIRFALNHLLNFFDAVLHHAHHAHHPPRASHHGRVESCCWRAERNEHPPTTGATPSKRKLPTSQDVAGWEPFTNQHDQTQFLWTTPRHCGRHGPGVPDGCSRPYNRCFDVRGVS